MFLLMGHEKNVVCQNWLTILLKPTYPCSNISLCCALAWTYKETRYTDKHLLIVRYIGGRSEVDEVTWRLPVGCERGDGGRVVVLGWSSSWVLLLMMSLE